MPEFLRARTEPWSAFAAELAALEWAMVESIHAETRLAIASDALATVRSEDWPHVRFVPSPALRVLSFRYPVNAFYQAFRSGAEPVLPDLEVSSVAVHREGFTLYRHDLTPLAGRLLAELVSGMPLGAALAELERDTAAETLAGVPKQLSEWFGAWVAAGFF